MKNVYFSKQIVNYKNSHFYMKDVLSVYKCNLSHCISFVKKINYSKVINQYGDRIWKELY